MKNCYVKRNTFSLNFLVKTFLVSFFFSCFYFCPVSAQDVYFTIHHDELACGGHDILFENTSLFDYQGDFEAHWSISRDDGFDIPHIDYSEILNFYHYFDVGEYKAHLKIIDSTGNLLGEHIDYFNINGVHIKPSKDEVCPGEEVIFRPVAVGINTIEEKYWVVDNKRYYEDVLRLTPDKEGYLDVQYITKGHECGTEHYNGIQVSNSAQPYPTIQFLTERSACTGGDRVVMQVKDASPSSTFQWNVHGNPVATGASHVYITDMTPGPVDVTVTETNICGNTSHEEWAQINVFEDKSQLNTNFDYIIEDVLCDSVQVRFRAKGSGNNYKWNINGTESAFSDNYLSDFYPFYIYDDVTVQLILQNGCGYSDTSEVENIFFSEDISDPVFSVFADHSSINDDSYDEGGQVEPGEDSIKLCPNEPLPIYLSGEINPGWEYFFIYDDPMVDGSDTIPFTSDSIVFQKEEEVDYYVYEVVAWDPVCEKTYYGMVNMLITVQSKKPESLLRVWPENICPGDRIYVWDDLDQRDYRYTYSVDFGDGNVYSDFKEPLDVHGPLASNMYDTEGSYQINFSVHDPVCNTSISTSGTIVVSDSADKTNSYFLYNSAREEQSPVQMKHVSTPPPTGKYFEVKVPVTWSEWETGNDSNLLLIMYNTNDMEAAGDDMPDFYSILSSPDLQTGDTAIAYIQNNFLQDSVMIFGFAWFCNSEHIFSDDIMVVTSKEPDVMIFEEGQLFILQDSGTYVHPPLELYANDPSGISPCSKVHPKQLKGKWINDQGSVLEIHETEEHNIEFYFSADTFMTDGELISYEMELAPSDYMLEFNDYGNYSCEPTASASLFVDFSGSDTLTFQTDEGTGCLDFTQKIEYETFIREDDREDDMNIVCPNELVNFDMFGVNNVVWDFGEGITKTGRSVTHRFAEVGDHEVFAYVENRCGQRDTLRTKVLVTDEYAPYADFNYSEYNIPNTFEFYAQYDDFDSYDREEKTQYIWVFDETDTIKGRSIIYTFPIDNISREYNVEFIISNACGTSSSIKTVWVESQNPCTMYDSVDFTITKDPDKWNQITIQSDLPDYNQNVSYALSLGNGHVEWSYADIVEGISSYYEKEGVYPVSLILENFDNMCVHTVNKKVDIVDTRCNAEFDFYFTSDLQVQLINLTPNITSVGWTLGDGASRYGENTTHTYAEDGIYEVCMQANTEVSSCNSCKTLYVGNFSQGCNISFSADITNMTATFDPEVISEGTVNLFWDFDNGKTSTSIAPSVTYNNTGQYNVCVTIQNNEGCLSRYCEEITIGEVDCQANFSFFVEPDNKVRFTNASSGQIDGYLLDFGNSRSSNKVDTSYQYSRTGTFDVCLSVYNSENDCQSTHCKKVTIGDTSTTALVADFSYIPTTDDPKTYTFKSSSTGSPTNFYWTFGDGTMQEGSGSVTHTYNKAGTYQSCLTINNFDGSNAETMQTSQKCYNISVSPDSIICSLNASFSYFVNTTEQKVIFNNTSSGEIEKFFWNFGNGKSSSSHSPSVIYDAPGFYLVSLSVMDESGSCVDYTARFIQVGSIDCSADFSTTFGPATNQVSFKDLSEGNIFNRYWDFGNGNISIKENPVQYYSRSGIYPVQLTVSDNTGTCVDSRTKPVQVGTVNCHASISVYVDSLTNTAYFSSDVIGDATDYYWIFGDGKTSTVANPVHMFKRSGYFNVSLSTLDENSGCMAYAKKSIMIGEQGLSCQSDFVYVVGDNNWVDFYDKSTGNIINHQWNFGDTARSFDQDPTHQFSTGYHNVCLFVENPAGIGNLNCKWIKVIPEEDTTNCKANFNHTVSDQTASFVNTSFGNYQKSTWSFDDNTISTDHNPIHTYDSIGYYRVKLIIEDTVINCKSSHVKLVNAGALDTLKAAFTAEELEQQLKVSGYPVDFVGIAHGDASKLRWEFGDGTVDSTSTTPTHYYQESGNYTACLTVSDPITGTSDQYCEQIKVGLESGIKQLPEVAGSVTIYPNPFIDYTTIAYKLVNNGQVSLGIYNINGVLIKNLINTYKNAGKHSIIFSGDNIASGVYYIKLVVNGQTTINKLVRY